MNVVIKSITGELLEYIYIVAYHDKIVRKEALGYANFKSERKCSICEIFNCPVDMRLHIKAAHEGIKYDCDHCDYQSGYKNLLRAHIKRVHELYRHKCSFCDELFSYSDHLRDHIRVVHEGVHFVCQICNRPHTRKKDFARHLVSDHTVSSLVDMNKIQYKCESCPFQTTNKRLMKTHLSKFHKDSFYKCGHKKVPETVNQREKLVCPVCTKMFAKDASGQSHNQQTFPCPFCDFETSQGINLQSHISSHHVVKKKEEKININITS